MPVAIDGLAQGRDKRRNRNIFRDDPDRKSFVDRMAHPSDFRLSGERRRLLNPGIAKC